MIYRAGEVPTGTKAFLDGVEVRLVTAADPANGWVEFYPDINKIESDNTIRTEIRRGTVVVVTPDGKEYTE